MAIAARLAKYGLDLEQIVWGLPLCVVNQFIIYDELANGRNPRWQRSTEQQSKSIEQLLNEALTPPV